MDEQILALRIDVVALRMRVEPEQSAVFLLNPDATVMYANERGRGALADRSILYLSASDVVRFRSAQMRSQFSAAMRQNGARPADMTLSAADVPNARLVRVSAEMAAFLQLPCAGSPRTVMCLLPPAAAPDVAAHLKAMDLSGAEAQIALALADGQTLAEIAGRRGVSIHTVRNQAKSAMAKAGVRRQAALVGLVERIRSGGGG